MSHTWKRLIWTHGQTTYELINRLFDVNLSRLGWFKVTCWVIFLLSINLFSLLFIWEKGRRSNPHLAIFPQFRAIRNPPNWLESNANGWAVPHDSAIGTAGATSMESSLIQKDPSYTSWRLTSVCGSRYKNLTHNLRMPRKHFKISLARPYLNNN